MKAKKHALKKHTAREINQADNDHKWMVLKLCVISMSVVIAVLWGFALKNQFVSADWNKTPEFELINNAQEQWKENKEATANDQETRKAAYEAVKTKLSEIIEEINTSTEENIINANTTSTSSTEKLEDTLMLSDKKINSQIIE